MPTVAFVTLGCRVNQYDSQALKERGEGVSFREVPLSEGADLVVVNTCTVTASADSDMRYWVRRAKRINPASVVVVTGCMALQGTEAFENVDLVVPNSEKSTLFDRAAPYFKTGPKSVPPVSQEPRPRDPWCGGISRFDGHRRAILKVQDGCEFACAYCAVPPARGKGISRPAEDIFEEGRRLASNGIHELVLAGVHLASYGRDQGKRSNEPRLAPVVEGLLSLKGIRRVRLSSYGVADFERGLLPLLKAGLCPHFHLPLQSGDPAVLKAMRRPYRLEHFAEKVAWVRESVPDAGITTDLIVGFPGEDEAAFENTLHIVETMDFLDFHLFPFSERPGTAAVGITPKVERSILRNRVERLRTLKNKRLEERAVRVSQQVVEVTAERFKKGFLGGTTDRGWKVAFPEGKHHPGDEVKVRLLGFGGDRSIGEVL